MKCNPKFGFQLMGRVIDSGYRGEIIIIGKTNMPFVIFRGDRIAQLVVTDCYTDFEFVDNFEDLSQTERV